MSTISVSMIQGPTNDPLNTSVRDNLKLEHISGRTGDSFATLDGHKAELNVRNSTQTRKSSGFLINAPNINASLS